MATSISALQDLIHLDTDAVKAYEQAIDACEHPTIATQLRAFQQDHERHVRDLSAELRTLGESPQVKTDLKGFFIEKFTAVVSKGTKSALVAMQGNEELTTAKYKAALDVDMPAGAKVLVMRHYEDEQRHLAWIKNCISRKAWETEPAITK